MAEKKTEKKVQKKSPKKGSKFYIKTLGCEKNTVDSENMMALLEGINCTYVEDPMSADILIVNTCGFILDAKEQSIEEIFKLVEIKRQRTEAGSGGEAPSDDGKFTGRQETFGKEKFTGSGAPVLIVTGCLAQRYAKDLAKEIPEADYIFGVNDYDKLPAVVASIAAEKQFADLGKKENACIFAGPEGKTFTELPRKSAGGFSAVIKIAEGCDNFCTYCAIPLMRGKYRSRKPEDIIKEAKALAKAGVRELVIIAQDVTYYGRDFGKKNMLPKLLKELCKISGIKWIRLMYCYEDEITPALIKTIRDEKKICKYIDIPLQHCNSGILKRMNRKSTKESITATIAKLRKNIPGIVIRTTMIVGFPGETKEEFEELLQFVKETKFDRLGAFAYSKEEGTAAYRMKNQVPKKTKQKRLEDLMELQRTISLENNQKYIGTKLPCVVEEIDGDSYIGRSIYDAEGIDNGVIFTSKKKLKPGDIVNVKINDAFDYDLGGKA